MTNDQLINQLKTMKNIRPNQEWVDLTWERIFEPSVAKRSIFDVFNISVPRFAAIGTLVGVVAIAGGFHIYTFGLVGEEIGHSPVLTASFEHGEGVIPVSVGESEEAVNFAVNNSAVVSTDDEDDEVEYNSSILSNDDKLEGGPARENYTVVFSEDAQERDDFQAVLRGRVETKISTIKDLFDQLENTDLARERELNPRRFEENFAAIIGEQGEGVMELLVEAEQSLKEGDLISALDMVNAIEKLIKD